jgi:hypothetical protein
MDPRRITALALLAAVPATTVALARSDGPTARMSGPCELALAPLVGPLRTVVVKSGEYSAPFLFDTGGGGTVLSPDAARALGLTTFGRLTGFRHDGGRVDGPRAGPVELDVGTIARRGEVGVLDLGAFLPDAPRLGGIVALDLFAGQRLTIDLAHERLFLETADTLRERTKDASELSVRVASQSGGAALDLFVALEGEHGKLWLELDCGNAGPVLLAPHAFVELGLDPPPAGRSANLELPIEGLGLVPCDVQQKELIYDGLLNAAFFAHHAVSLDLAAARAWARANP